MYSSIHLGFVKMFEVNSLYFAMFILISLNQIASILVIADLIIVFRFSRFLCLFILLIFSSLYTVTQICHLVNLVLYLFSLLCLLNYYLFLVLFMFLGIFFILVFVYYFYLVFGYYFYLFFEYFLRVF